MTDTAAVRVWRPSVSLSFYIWWVWSQNELMLSQIIPSRLWSPGIGLHRNKVRLVGREKPKRWAHANRVAFSKLQGYFQSPSITLIWSYSLKKKKKKLKSHMKYEKRHLTCWRNKIQMTDFQLFTNAVYLYIIHSSKTENQLVCLHKVCYVQH